MLEATQEIGSEYNSILNVTSVLHRAVAAQLNLEPETLPREQVQLVRKSLDARPRRRGRRNIPGERDVCWSHVVDVCLTADQAKRIKAQPGRIVPAAKERAAAAPAAASTSSASKPPARGHESSVVVVGAGPCGLFAALTLARAGHRVTLCERGKPVEERGRSIGALVKRGVVDGESNFCYGEGGAGTWSDGKLTTRIGRNSAEVRQVLETLVHFGAPPRILLDGKPHLGTDNLVRLLKNFRSELISCGTDIRWDARVDTLLMADEGRVGPSGSPRVAGVRLASGEELPADAVILAAGHSARELYLELLSRGATLAPKDFAVGFRVEHPQEVINTAQYGDAMAQLCRKGGKGPLPPASYRLATTVRKEDLGTADGSSTAESKGTAADTAADERGIYSFCMCPGGQIVPTSMDDAHLCVNGMSYSNRGSKWANSAVVVSVGSKYGDYDGLEGPDAGGIGTRTGGSELPPELAGLRFQEAMEARAAGMGGEGLICPVQRVSDFVEGRLSEDPLPESSYRRGVKSAPLHELYPPAITEALRVALKRWGRTMQGFDGDQALLHGVETRTSAPVQIVRDDESCEARGLEGLFPAGEGAGYAGGIVSAAVDGLRVAKALLGSQKLIATGAEGEKCD